MHQRTLASALAALLVLIAGCTGAPVGDSGSPSSATDADGMQSVDGGSVDFYISDEKNAISEFRHVNVTVTKVGFQRANGSWVERDVNDTTVDLTELQGANATQIGTLDLGNGTYNKVFVHVSEVNGTLKNGEQVNVKLPSQKLKLNKGFTVNESSDVDFVFDITVFKAGNSGKYVVKPVVSESGTDVPIEEREKADEGDDEGDELNATFVGNVTRGENVTVEVTRNGTAVENATVVVNDEEVGTTGADGRLTFEVPENATELKVEVTADDAEAELEMEFEEEEEDEESTQTATPTATPTPTPTATETSSG